MDAPPALPRDERLPQLARAVDPLAMQQVFAAALRDHHGQHVTACAVDRIKYRPGRNCTVSYRLTIRDERQACSYEQRVAGRFCAAGDAVRRHARHRSRLGLASRCGVPALLVPSLELFAWFLPNDPELAALPALLATARDGGSALSEAIAVMTGGDSDAVEHRASLVQYVPETRACARFDVMLANGRQLRLFAKLDHDAGGAATHRLMQALYDSPARRDGRLRTPRPLLWQAETGLHWQASVPGAPLLDVHPHCPPDVAATIGRLIAALHDTPAPTPRQIARDALQAQPAACARLLGQVEPRWAPSLDHRLELLHDGASAAGALPPATLHGDLHPRNLLIDGRKLSLIDLDGACRGPAVLELGAWIADGLYRAQLTEAPLEAVQESAAHLLAAYAGCARQPADPRLVAWATARALLCDRAYRGVANLKPGRLERVPALIRLATLIAERRDILATLPR